MLIIYIFYNFNKIHFLNAINLLGDLWLAKTEELLNNLFKVLLVVFFLGLCYSNPLKVVYFLEFSPILCFSYVEFYN